MSVWRQAAVLLAVVVAAAGCGRTRVPSGVPATPSACVRLQSERQVRGETLCEDAFSCYLPPNGESDRIGLRRLAPCNGGGGPVVLYFPGMFMNGEILRDERQLRSAPLSRAGGLSHLEPRLPDARGPRERQSPAAPDALRLDARHVPPGRGVGSHLRPRCRPGPALPRRLQLWSRDRVRPGLARQPAGRGTDHPRRRAGR